MMHRGAILSFAGISSVGAKNGVIRGELAITTERVAQRLTAG